MIGGRHWAAATLALAAGVLAPLEPENDPVETEPGRWRWRIRRRGHVAELRGSSREEVTAKVLSASEEDAREEEEARRVAAEHAEQRRAQQIEADRRWAEDRPHREQRIREQQAAEEERMRREHPKRWAQKRADEYNRRAPAPMRPGQPGPSGKSTAAWSAIPPLTWTKDDGLWVSEWFSLPGSAEQKRFLLFSVRGGPLFTIDEGTDTYPLEAAKKECSRRRRVAMQTRGA